MPKHRLTQPQRKKATLQIHDIFKLLEIEQTIEAERLAQTLLNFLIYMAPQDEIHTPWAKFVKIAPDLICLLEVSDDALKLQTADAMDAKAVITLPT